MHAASDILEPHDAISANPPGRLWDYYELTKPRMNFLVVITTMVGFYMASPIGQLRWINLLHAILGTAFTAAGASIFNQLIEMRWDALMPRTRNRPLPAGRLAPREALLFAAAMGIIGVTYLAILVNPLTAMLGAVTLLSYVGIYTPLKRRTTLNTVVGAVPGAIPAIMGFTAASGMFSTGAAALFGILFFWQMPHFLAIAMLYKDDYTAGGFKMLPCVDERVTARQMILYALALIPVSLLPTLLGMSGPAYFTAAMLLGLAFLSFAVSCAASMSRLDCRKLFFASIVYLPLLMGAMMYDKV
jgi:protoheme IX farnesyltransferase